MKDETARALLALNATNAEQARINAAVQEHLAAHGEMHHIINRRIDSMGTEITKLLAKFDRLADRINNPGNERF